MKVMLALTANAVLDKITSYDIFKYYIAGFNEVGKLFCSELRNDKNPTCAILFKKSDLFYKDFKFSDQLNCFSYVKAKYNVSFNDALAIINSDFNLGLINMYNSIYNINTATTKMPIIYNKDYLEFKEKEFTIIQVVKRGFNINDKKYWFDNYNISSEDLNKAKIFPLQEFWINGIYYKASNLCYGYYFGLDSNNNELWKIYQPYSKIKWLSNVSTSVFQGYDLLPDTGDLLIITKSWKDILVLSKLNIYSIAPQSEGSKIYEEFINSLKQRFKKIIILYDNDSTGKRNALELSNLYAISYIFVPEEFKVKDCSDYVKKYSLLDLSNYLKTHGISCNYP